jgi:hypothetical protein
VTICNVRVEDHLFIDRSTGKYLSEMATPLCS